MRLKIIIYIILLIVIIAGAVLLFTLPSSTSESFQVDSIFIKGVIRPDNSFNTSIQVMNILSYKQDFNISVYNLEKFASVDTTGFSLNAGEIKQMPVALSNIQNEPLGIYTGSVVISNSVDKKIIPIIIELESEDVLFDSNVALYPSDAVKPGENVNAEIRIFDLSSRENASSVKVTFLIKDNKGNIISSNSEDISVKGQETLIKTVSLPENIKDGNYIFAVILEGEGSVGTSSALFSVGKEKTNTEEILGLLGANTNSLYIIIIIIEVIGLLVFILFSVSSKDKVLEEMRKQCKEALEKQEKYLDRKERENEKLLESKMEKELNRRLFDKIKRERRRAIEEVHKERVKKIRKLKGSKKENEMKKQLDEWKKKGYDTSVLESVALPEAAYIKKKIKEWKKKGYKTDILDGGMKK
jgi:hypothetical protein